MKEQISNVINWLKDQPVNACITGSCLLDYFEGQDVDIFCYDSSSFTKLVFAMQYDPMFIVTDKLEKWKLDKFINKDINSYKKHPLITIRYLYNTCLTVNITLKQGCDNIFSVISRFDMNIIAKGYDIRSKQYLDLTGNSTITKIAEPNIWNTKFDSFELWENSQLLRQIHRCIKYHKRGYNTDAVVAKFIEIADRILEYDNIFKSNNFKERHDDMVSTTLIVKGMCKQWLETHEISDKAYDELMEISFNI